MKIAFDVDGVLTAHYPVLTEIGRAMRASGHEVYILTGNHLSTLHGDRADLLPDLADGHGDWYDEIITFEDHEPERGLIASFGARSAVGQFKRRVARDKGINFLFDDDVAHVRKMDGVHVVGIS